MDRCRYIYITFILGYSEFLQEYILDYIKHFSKTGQTTFIGIIFRDIIPMQTFYFCVHVC